MSESLAAWRRSHGRLHFRGFRQIDEDAKPKGVEVVDPYLAVGQITGAQNGTVSGGGVGGQPKGFGHMGFFFLVLLLAVANSKIDCPGKWKHGPNLRTPV